MANTLPVNFDYKSYLLLNPDLDINANYDQAKDHYLKYGCNENRKYTKNYDSSSDIHILVVIISCCKHSHLWDEIKNRTNNDLIIIAGTNDDNIKGYDKINKIFYLNCNDYYDGLPEKIILMIEEVLNNPDFSHITHILKIDDHDNWFNDDIIKNLYNYYELLVFDYIGQKLNHWTDVKNCKYHFGKVPEFSYWHNRTSDISDVTYFDGGCSYILNRKAMNIVNRVYNSTNLYELRTTHIYEDLMIGQIVIGNNVTHKRLSYGVKGDK
jgi:hypothetical protein